MQIQSLSGALAVCDLPCDGEPPLPLGRASPVAKLMGIRSRLVSREQVKIHVAADKTHAVIEAAAAAASGKKAIAAWIVRASYDGPAKEQPVETLDGMGGTAKVKDQGLIRRSRQGFVMIGYWLRLSPELSPSLTR